MSKVKTGYLEELAENIVADWSNNKGRFGVPTQAQLNDLAFNIKDHGQAQPIVCKYNKSKQLVVDIGYCRHTALLILNEIEENEGKPKTKIKYVLENGEEDEKAHFLKQLGENHFRTFSPMDMSKSMRVMSEHFKMTQQEIAEFFCFKSQGTVSQYLSLMKLDNGLQHKLHTGLLSYTDAMALLKVPENLRNDVAEKATDPESGKISVKKNKGTSESSDPKELGNSQGKLGDTRAGDPRLPGSQSHSHTPTFVKSPTDLWNDVTKWENANKLSDDASRVCTLFGNYFRGTIKGVDFPQRANDLVETLVKNAIDDFKELHNIVIPAKKKEEETKENVD